MDNVSKSPPIAGRSDMPARWERGLRSPLTLGLVSSGGIGAFLFTITYLVEGIKRPGYDVWKQPISALSLGPGGWVQQVNFIIFGVLVVISAVGWYRFLTPGRGGIWFPLLQGISGLCLIGAGAFSMDPFPGYPPGITPGPSTVHGTLHSMFAWVLIITLAMGCFVFAQYARLAHRRGWFVYSLITSILILIFWDAFVQGASGNITVLVPLAGVVERLSAVSHALWLCLLVVTLLLQSRSQRNRV